MGNRHTRTVAAILALVLALTAGCAQEDRTESSTEVSVTGSGNAVTLSNLGDFYVRVPDSARNLNVTFDDVSGNVRVLAGNKDLHGSISGADAKVANNSGDMVLDIEGTASSQVGDANLQLPRALPSSIHVRRGRGTFSFDLSQTKVTTVVIENYQGNIALVMPMVAGVTVRVEGGSGSIKITSGGVPLTITAQGSSVKVPSNFRTINGAFVSPRYASGVVSASVTVSEFRGVVELIDK